MSEKEILVRLVEGKIELILKELEVKDSIIQDLRLKNEQLARALIETIAQNSVPLPKSLSSWEGVI